MFWNGRKLKKIYQKLQKQQSAIESYIRDLSDENRNRLEWCTAHQRECKSVGLLMWEKDTDGRYTFLNHRHCNDFFQISLADVRDIIGKTQAEAIQDFKGRTKQENTFGELCGNSDAYTLEQNKSCRFWEIGYINGEIFIFDVTKKPLIKDGELIGISGWALNQSDKECEIKCLLENFLDSGEAIRLASDSKKGAVYVITKRHNPFGGVFPK